MCGMYMSFLMQDTYAVYFEPSEVFLFFVVRMFEARGRHSFLGIEVGGAVYTVNDQKKRSCEFFHHSQPSNLPTLILGMRGAIDHFIAFPSLASPKP